MVKTLAAVNKSEREPFKIPRSVQQSIPIQRVFRDGIWQTGRSRYSRTWRFADINYSVASHEDHRHQHGQQGEQELPQGQPEKQAFLIVPDFFVDADFYGYHLRNERIGRQTVARPTCLW